jgi:hypothetical protein
MAFTFSPPLNDETLVAGKTSSMCIIVNSMMFICLYGYASVIFAQDTFQLSLTHFLTLVLH